MGTGDNTPTEELQADHSPPLSHMVGDLMAECDDPPLSGERSPVRTRQAVGDVISRRDLQESDYTTNY
ncbi:unnamed protein product [Nippostrongylus brasiliensis]|uniref:Acyl-CoA synthetase n=1 Tax=Nippostrongylus brasiliensis TaxID=27835 RepID=A0A0N4XMA3_NIPBR|nr:hypothetical protein Q1695_016128 [Nippostrongylus brasiliensis]VDL67246.1 unnamed protein product [Nippostrongylus brasiliensis]